MNTNTTGVYPPAVAVGGTDVLNPITEVREYLGVDFWTIHSDDFLQIENLATNDAAHLSLSEYAVLAIAPDLAPNNFANAAADGDETTLAGSDKSLTRSTQVRKGQSAGKNWKRLFCL